MKAMKKTLGIVCAALLFVSGLTFANSQLPTAEIHTKMGTTILTGPPTLQAVVWEIDHEFDSNIQIINDNDFPVTVKFKFPNGVSGEQTLDGFMGDNEVEDIVTHFPFNKVYIKVTDPFDYVIYRGYLYPNSTLHF